MTVQLLTDEAKSDIRERVSEGQSKASVARHYGVSERTVGRVCSESSDTKPVEPKKETQKKVATKEPVVKETASKTDDAEYTVLLNRDSISINRMLNKKTTMKTILFSDPRFQKMFDDIWENKASKESLERGFKELDIERKIMDYTNGRIKVFIEKAEVLIDGVIKAPISLAKKLIENIKQNKTMDVDKYARFTEKLSENVSNSILNRLYDFIACSSIEVDKDGFLICYKRVNANYTDVYTGTIDNSVGKVVSVRRNQVDENMDRTCSYGLHVCSKGYLPNYSGAKILKCRVNPSDVVAIPRDYNDSKIRVCKYEVLEDVTGKI